METGTGTNGRNQGKRRIAIIVQYDGRRFNGFQVQDSGRTVQGELEKALKILLREDIRITASGRTDTGVHALGQVAHFDTSSSVSLKRLLIGMNGILGKDVALKNAYYVDNDFHARFSAVSREYIYLIHNHQQRSPFMMYRAMWIRDQLDIDYRNRVASYLVGEHDFASFCKAQSQNGSTTRFVEKAEFTASDSLVVFTIRGNAFLHNMIRIIIGTIVEMNVKMQPEENIKNVLAQKNRIHGGITAPPYGLYLNSIIYTPGLDEMNIELEKY
ncbi:MAG TPA: tRNA pseudouridine(38-40) synthase TruA [Spirochaetota bacterium]|nr:tRNA pseudouridine(38-40) synthase TruA [Spirochaetota bacterium]